MGKIDIIDIKNAVKNGEIRFFLKKEKHYDVDEEKWLYYNILYCKDTLTDEVVELMENCYE